MSYVDGSQINTETAERERDLLLSGFSYTEIANITGGRVKSISERNRLVYKINIWEAFQRRIERDGVPVRLTVSDAFGYWFSGFFDGEGTISIFTRPHTHNAAYSEYRLSVRIMVRDDDADVIARIQDNLKVGNVTRHKLNGATNPAISWTCERVQDLTEVVIPLLDRYPLYTKKAKEYTIWKPVVMQRYITTLGGYSNRSGTPENQRLAFHAALKAIGEIRTYAARE